MLEVCFFALLLEEVDGQSAILLISVPTHPLQGKDRYHEKAGFRA